MSGPKSHAGLTSKSPTLHTLHLADVKSSTSTMSTPTTPTVAFSSSEGDVVDSSSTTSAPAEGNGDVNNVDKTNKDNSQPRGQKRKRQAAQNDRRKPAPDPAEFNLTPWVDDLGMTEYDSKEQRLHDEIVAFVAWLEPRPEERIVRQAVVARVSKVVSGRFRDAIVTVFGSVAHGLSFPDGDIDLVVHTRYAVDQEEKKRSLYQLKARLDSAGLIQGTDVHVITRAKVPLLVFKMAPELGNYHVDVSINAEDGLRAIDIIKNYTDKMLALKPLVLLVKALLLPKSLGSAATSGLGSFAIICMVLFFLQTNPTSLPAEQISSPYQLESLGHLALALLKYYASDFPYSTGVICCAAGTLLSKSELGWVDEKKPELLSVRSLVNPDADITRHCTKIDQVREVFKQAHERLSAFEVASSNMLGAAVGFERKTVNFREHIKSVVETGAIHKNLKPAPPLNFPGNVPAPSNKKQAGHWKKPQHGLEATQKRQAPVPQSSKQHYQRADPVDMHDDQRNSHAPHRYEREPDYNGGSNYDREGSYDYRYSGSRSHDYQPHENDSRKWDHGGYDEYTGYDYQNTGYQQQEPHLQRDSFDYSQPPVSGSSYDYVSQERASYDRLAQDASVYDRPMFERPLDTPPSERRLSYNRPPEMTLHSQNQHRPANSYQRPLSIDIAQRVQPPVPRFPPAELVPRAPPPLTSAPASSVQPSKVNSDSNSVHAGQQTRWPFPLPPNAPRPALSTEFGSGASSGPASVGSINSASSIVSQPSRLYPGGSNELSQPAISPANNTGAVPPFPYSFNTPQSFPPFPPSLPVSGVHAVFPPPTPEPYNPAQGFMSHTGNGYARRDASVEPPGKRTRPNRYGYPIV